MALIFDKTHYDLIVMKPILHDFHKKSMLLAAFGDQLKTLSFSDENFLIKDVSLDQISIDINYKDKLKFTGTFHQWRKSSKKFKKSKKVGILEGFINYGIANEDHEDNEDECVLKIYVPK